MTESANSPIPIPAPLPLAACFFLHIYTKLLSGSRPHVVSRHECSRQRREANNKVKGDIKLLTRVRWHERVEPLP